MQVVTLEPDGHYRRVIAIIELVIAVVLTVVCGLLLFILLFPAPATHWEGPGSAWAAIGLVALLPAWAGFAVAGITLLSSARWRWAAQVLPVVATAWLVVGAGVT